MAIITSIEQQKNNPERYNIYIHSGTKETFLTGVDQDILIRFSLKKGVTIDQQQIEDMIYQDHLQKGFQKALRYLATKMRTSSEIADFLKRYEYREDAIQSIIDKLINYKYIDDQLYAQTYVKEQILTGKRGPLAIRQALEKKSVPANLIAQALTAYTETLQIENALALMAKKHALTKRKSLSETKKILAQSLCANGFSWEIIEAAWAKSSFADEESNLAAIRHQGMKFHRKYSLLPEQEYMYKLKQALYRKGFREEEIEMFIAEIEDTKGI